MIPLRKTYQNRFSTKEQEKKDALWEMLCENVFQKFVRRRNTIIDIGAGYCEFINNIDAGKKIAIDNNPDLPQFTARGVTALVKPFTKIPKSYNGTADVIFLSNVLEHLDSKEAALDLLIRCNQLLKRGGKLMILQPNISLVGHRYWDFFDHKVAFNERSIVEGLILAGFTVEKVVKRFLPYSTKHNALPLLLPLVRLYLAIPYSIRPFAGQSFFLAVKQK